MIVIKVSPQILADLFLEIRFYMTNIARKIGVDDFLFIQLKEEDCSYFSDEMVLVYGINEFFPPELEKENIFDKLKEQIQSPVFVVNSSCLKIGFKEEPFLFFQAMIRSAQQTNLTDKLKELDQGWKIQSSLIGSNIMPKGMDRSYVEVIVSPKETIFLPDLIGGLKLAKEVWPKIAIN